MNCKFKVGKLYLDTNPNRVHFESCRIVKITETALDYKVGGPIIYFEYIKPTKYRSWNYLDFMDKWFIPVDSKLIRLFYE